MSEHLLFRIALALTLIGFAAHRGYYHRRLAAPIDSVVEQRASGAGSIAAGIIAIPALLSTIVFLLSPNFMSWSAFPLSSGLRWLGVGIALMGFALLQWSHQALGRNWSDEARILEGHQLVTSGPYRWIRHPIYAAFLMIFGSSLLISANWFVGGLWIAMTAMHAASRVRIEEELMLWRFGSQYRSYMRRTGRLLPRINARGEKKAL